MKEKDFVKIVYLALSRTYLSAFEEATKGEAKSYKPSAVSTTASWSIEVDNQLNFHLVNTKLDIVFYLDQGTKPHKIRPKNKKSLRWVSGGSAHFAGEVNHPGTTGRKFINKILNDKGLEDEFMAIIMDKLEKHL